MLQAKVAEITRDLEPPKRRRVLERPGMVRLPAEVFKELDDVTFGEEFIQYKLTVADVAYLMLVVDAIENNRVNPRSRVDGDGITCTVSQPFWDPKWQLADAGDASRGWLPGNGGSSNHPSKNLERLGWLTFTRNGALWTIAYGPRLKKLLDLDEDA
jgi:hypothetical protein